MNDHFLGGDSGTGAMQRNDPIPGRHLWSYSETNIGRAQPTVEHFQHLRQKH